MLSARRPLLVILLGLAGALAVVAPSSGAGEVASICGTGTGQVAMTVAANPGEVSPSETGRASYAQLTVLVENCGPSTKNSAILDVRLPIATTPAPEGCALLPDGRCSVGTLRAGAQHTLTLTVQAPEVTGTAPTAELRYADESSNGQTPESSREIITAANPLTIKATEGAAASWVPALTDTTLFATAGGQSAKVHVPGQASGVSASLGRDARAYTCPKQRVCRKGPWFEVNVAGGVTITGGLTHTLTWPSSLVDRKQSRRNLVIVHEPGNGASPYEITSDCASDADVRCVKSYQLDATGLTVVVRTATNGRMR